MESGIDTAVTDHLLSTTRAVRRHLDLERPVERSVILDCLRLAVQAPTASNRQNWRWLVVTDQEKRAALGELYRSFGQDYLAQAAGREGDGQTRRVYESALLLADTLGRVPVHVIPCIEQDLTGADHITLASAYGSIVPAAWSFMLALRSRGLGSAWTTLHLGRAAEAAELLGIPAGVTQIALLPVAYTTKTDFRPAERPPVEEVTYWDSWGSR